MSRPSGENRIVVDWDDTCVRGLWPRMGEWLPGAQRALSSLLAAGYEVVVFSTRLAPLEPDERTPRDPAVLEAERARIRAMLDNDLRLRQVKIWEKPWKPGAAAYIDDKSVHFDGDWPETMNVLWRRLGVPRLRLLRGGRR